MSGRKLNVNAKCIFEIDHEGWLSIRDGYAEIGLAPDELDALRKFLTPPNPVAGEGPETREGTK